MIYAILTRGDACFDERVDQCKDLCEADEEHHGEESRLRTPRRVAEEVVPYSAHCHECNEYDQSHNKHPDHKKATNRA